MISPTRGEVTNNFAGKSDEELLAISIRQPSLFSVLVDRYQEAFLRKGQNILKSHEDAEDIVQETFAKIYINAASFHRVEGASFKSWAYKILLNNCFSVYKKNKADKEMLARLDREIFEIIPDRGVILNQEKELTADYLISLIARLPNVLSRAIKLHFIDDKSQKEVADILGISENAVRTRIHRGKKLLKEINKFEFYFHD